MLESFNSNIIEVLNTGQVNSALGLAEQYVCVRTLLSKHLTSEQFDFIPSARIGILSSTASQIRLIQELITASSMAVSYLKSLDMNLDKEFELKKEELKRQEQEVESLKKLLNKSLEAIKNLPELQRSKIVEEIKKSHRQIEEHSKK